jgi:tungstate transport system substrate-binding protein
LLFLILLTGCISGNPQKLVLATTTSTYDSGLLDALNPVFEEKYNVRVEVLHMGTGAAIRTAMEGNADVILVHAPAKEKEFVAKGYGINRTSVMYNDFVIVGPVNDPASIEGKNASEAFRKIAQNKAIFFSRGDNSGTHTKEKEIWRMAGIVPAGKWYCELGKGMGETLRVANEKDGYLLTDRGTYLSQKENLPRLKILVQGPVKGGDPILANPYSVIAVNPVKYPERNYELAMAYIRFLTSKEGQEIIANFKIGGEQLFFPIK